MHDAMILKSLQDCEMAANSYSLSTCIHVTANNINMFMIIV